MQSRDKFEDNYFVIDKLGPGTCINFRAFFINEIMYVNMKALTDVKILSLSLKKLKSLVDKHGEIATKRLNEQE